MNAENFYEYIREPARLHQISYQELKSLVLQYPYAQNLRYLLVQKSLLEGHAEFDKNLHAASALSPDRKHLYLQLKELRQLEIQDDPFTLEEEFLELRDLSAFEESTLQATDNHVPQESVSALEEIVPASKSTEEFPPLESSDIFALKPASEDKHPEPASILDIPILTISSEKSESDQSSYLEGKAPEEVEPELKLIRMEEQQVTPPDPAWVPSQRLFDLLYGFGHLLKTWRLPLPQPIAPSPAPKKEPLKTAKPVTASIDKLKKKSTMNVKNERPTPAPVPKSSFSSWIKQFQSPQTNLRLETIMESSRPIPSIEKKKKSEKKGDKAEALAQKSLRENHDLASETLAMILEKQGHYDKAIRMYERLGLIFPEKSGFFAEKIKNLKKR